ncbi:MAG: TIR domain-containing protein [Pseudonocardiaceae bacterium]
MLKVFISHSSKDQKPTEEVQQWLVAEGHTVFLDRDLRNGLEVGEDWQRRVNERLRWADAVVCVVTSAFLTSQWCPYEVGYAQARGSRLLPVLAEPGVDHPLVKSAHYADLTEDPTKARAALVEALRQIDAAGGLGWADDRSPFPGLRAFEVEDHLVFFGRHDEVERLAGLLRSPVERADKAVVLVLGPSGCGKSSLVRAGLLHVMAEEPGWCTLPPMLPGADPVAALVRKLAAVAQQLGLDWTVADVLHRLDDGGLTGLTDDLLLAARARRLLVVVDQFEELLTRTPSPQRARFAQLLHPALGGPVQVVATLRSEFLDQLLADADLAMLPTRPYPLRPLHREALRAVIEGPAKLAGIAVDDDLVARLVDDTDSGEALPLLAFTLSQLADVGRGQLSQRHYDQLGGVQGALTRQADIALADAIAATGRRREEVIAGLLRLVTVDEQGRPTRWRVPHDELPEPVSQELDIFIDRRLLTTDKDNGNVVVGVTHEKILSAWPPLAQAIENHRSALRARRAVEQATSEWSNGGRSPARLWERGQLAAAVADTGARFQGSDLATDRVDLSKAARAFLRASIRRDRFRRGRAITVLSVLLVVALVAAGIAYTEQRVAVEQRNATASRQAAGQALELRDTNPALATQLGLTAYRLAPTTEARGSLLSTLATRYATQLTGHTNAVYSVAFSPDERTLATASADHTARLWDVHDPYHPAPLGTLTGHNNVVYSVAFSPDGRSLATASLDNTARLWDVHDPHHPIPLGTLTGHIDNVLSVAFSLDGRTLATASADHTARLWDLQDLHHPTPLGTLTGHNNAVRSVTFSPDGLTLATTSTDHTARLWDLHDPHHPTALSTLTGHTNDVYSAAFSPDGRTLATTSIDNTARLWDIHDPHHPTALSTLTGHTNYVKFAAFSPDGHTLATASLDGTARLWDIHDLHQPTALGALTGHTDSVTAVAFSPDGRTLATASTDNTTRLWHLPGPIVAGHTNYVFSVAFSSDGRTLATASADHTARLWDLYDPHHPTALSTLTGHTNYVYSVAFSPDGRTLATASADHTARLWDIHDPHHPTTLSTLTGHTDTIRSVAFSPDGYTLATAGTDNTARLWGLHDPHHPTTLSTLLGHTSAVSSVAFSPDGHTLATASADHTTRLWDLSTPHHPTPLGTLTGHTDYVHSVAFSADGHTLATASADHTARLWETNVDRVAARICSINPAITKSEWDQYLPDLPYQPPCQRAT